MLLSLALNRGVHFFSSVGILKMLSIGFSICQSLLNHPAESIRIFSHSIHVVSVSRGVDFPWRILLLWTDPVLLIVRPLNFVHN